MAVSIKRTTPLCSKRGMVATSQPLASEVGREILKEGGTAVDATIAMAAALVLCEPTANGLGGDAFAMVWADGELVGLQASGRAPRALNPALLKQKGFVEMPKQGWESVTVPGAVSGWIALHRRFGKLPLQELLQPAIHYCQQGFVVQPRTAQHWQRAAKLFAEQEGFRHSFLPLGRAPKAGERFKHPDLGRSLEVISQHGERGFYEILAEQIVAYSKGQGGYFELADFHSHQAEFVQPISINYRGVDIWELPPNTQGIAALMALGMTAHFPLPTAEFDAAKRWHVLIEAMRLSFATTYAHVADPDGMRISIEELLDPSCLQKQAERISLQKRMDLSELNFPKDAGTVYLCAADSNNMMVSFIQSNYYGFGSGIVVPGTGIALHNRGYAFSLNPTSPNLLAPGKRPFHTIMPGFLTKAGQPLGPFGIMGGMMQPQAHLQVVSSIVDQGDNIQQAINSARIRINPDDQLSWEAHLEPALLEKLRALGHRCRADAGETSEFGGGQIIYFDRDRQEYQGASDPRKDGVALGL